MKKTKENEQMVDCHILLFITHLMTKIFSMINEKSKSDKEQTNQEKDSFVRKTLF